MINVEKRQNLTGRLFVSGDKSITIRAILLSSLQKTFVKIVNPLVSKDTLSAIDCVKNLGATIKWEGKNLLIKGFEKPNDNVILNSGNSGTTARLIIGMVAGLNIHAVVVGDESLSKRPMNRVIDPLLKRGASIKSNNGCLPVEIFPSTLKNFEFQMQTDSAQVKSALLFSGVTSNKETIVIEKNKTRDHTEKMLEFMGADISVDNKKITLLPSNIKLSEITVPNDPSSAYYYLALGLFLGEITVPKVLLNNLRGGFLKILSENGGRFYYENRVYDGCFEKADITAYKSEINYFEITKENIPSLIDELPLIALVALLNKGCKIFDAGELKIKESDRLSGICELISLCGGNAEINGDNLTIYPLKKGRYFKYSSNDHRMTMCAYVLMTILQGGKLSNEESAYISFPSFYKNLNNMPLGLIGVDVSSSLSGVIHKLILSEIYNSSFTYECLSIGRENIDDFFNKCPYKAFNATYPYKNIAFERSDIKSKLASLCGFSNYLIVDNNKIKCFNTDGKGMEIFLEGENINLEDKDILICGAGGAGTSIALALKNRCKNIYIKNRTLEKSKILNEKSGGKVKIYNGEKCQIIINATTLKDECPFTKEEIENSELVIDINYGKKTATEKVGEKNNKKCYNGLGMLFYQAYLSDIILLNKDCDYNFSKKIYKKFLNKLKVEYEN